MKSKTKKQILKALAQNLSLFHPEYKESFMCPTCMKVIKVVDLNRISEAHIIPKSAGGNLKTFICRECNSNFGAKQDKWFGDMINIANSPNGSILSTAIKQGYFIIDGLKVNGSWEQKQDGSFSFSIHLDRNPPHMKETLDNKFKNKPPKTELSIPVPILKNKRLVDVGFLTAAYLMWFALLGYSWVLQKHLDIVRKQIMCPEDEIIKSNFLLTTKSANWEPWIGLSTIFGDTYPSFGLKKQLVILPPRDRPNIYDTLNPIQTEINISDIKPFKINPKPNYGPPIDILFENRLIVFAEPSEEAKKHTFTLYYSNDSNKPTVLRPIDEKKFDEMRKVENVKHISIKLDG